MTDNPDAERREGAATIGYTRVDDQPETGIMIELMDTVGRWPAVRRLRAWEAERLALRPGDRVLDVGCGPGDVALAMAARVAPSGRVTGLDASTAMVAVAGERAAASGLPVDFRVADAEALDLPDGSVDAARTERMLQWVDDPRKAVAELVRVVRPDGRLVLIDTDWRTLAFDLPDRDAAANLMGAIVAARGEQGATGGRLVNLCRDTGLVELSCDAQTHLWLDWDPDDTTGEAEIFPLRTVIPQLVQAGALGAAAAERLLAAIVDAGRRGRLFMSLTMLAVSGRVPPP